jgi:hypothetical protein
MTSITRTPLLAARDEWLALSSRLRAPRPAVGDHDLPGRMKVAAAPRVVVRVRIKRRFWREVFAAPRPLRTLRSRAYSLLCQ